MKSVHATKVSTDKGVCIKNNSNLLDGNKSETCLCCVCVGQFTVLSHVNKLNTIIGN